MRREMDAIRVTSDEIDSVRKYFNVTEENVRKHVVNIKKWIKKQPNLLYIEDENFIERFLLRNKFRIEQTKEKLNGYGSLRGAHLNLFENWQSIIPSREATTTLPLPKLTPSLERVIVWKLRTADPSLYDLKKIVKYNLLLFEVLIRTDYAVGDRFVADFTDHSFASIMRNNPLVVARFISLYRSAYSGRMVAVDFINAPPYVNFLLSFLKKLLPGKLYERIRIHKDLASFQAAIPKECLPSDYGGDLDSVENLIRKWDKVFENNRRLFEENFKSISKK